MAKSDHQGSVKDPEHDGRLKENREAGRTKGTTPGSDARAREHGHEPAESSHSRSQGGSSGGSRSGGGGQGGGGSQGRGEQSQAQGGSRSGGQGESDDLKSREYRDAQGNVHHHTRTYIEQHGKEGGGGGNKYTDPLRIAPRRQSLLGAILVKSTGFIAWLSSCVRLDLVPGRADLAHVTVS
ncbi:MAG: hypothetical protein JO110_20875 [Acetobacteraceae bacterium]|nr:hypothetical protein [Acetobacteraceae bacterium]